MDLKELQEAVDHAWEQKLPCGFQVLEKVFLGLDQGLIRVAEKTSLGWQTHEWVKRAILSYFSEVPSQLLGDPSAPFYDKLPLKCSGWTIPDFEKSGFRLVPGAIVRWGSFIGPRCVVMPSFINTGVYVGSGTMIDTDVRVGSCAQIGENCHLAGGVGIGGVLEPAQAIPVIIEDNCFIGARCQVAEGMIVEEGSVLAMGVMVGTSTKIIHRETGETFQGRIPAYSVVVPGTYTTPEYPSLGIDCAIIIKQVDAKTRAKTEINTLLRA
jgi:2,3,4,5-tetrahydropyridine-2-carboxylate N-succinyltransferase